MLLVHVEEYLREAAARWPEKLALRDKTAALTYAELYGQVRSAASLICERTGSARRQPIFVCITRSVQSVVLFLAAAVSGNCYVPVDLSLPRKRLLDMARVIRPVLLLTTEKCGEPCFDDLTPISYAEAVDFPVNDEVLAAQAARAMDTDPLYCIFTSGSTGIPKAVCVAHRSVIDMVEAFSEAFPIDTDTVFGNQAPFDFDVSVKDIYLTLKHGATMTILERMLFSFPVRLIERLNDWGVNTLIWAVSAMKLTAELKAFEVVRPAVLRLVMFSGEVMPTSVLASWKEASAETLYVNLYGPTEITCNCTYHIIRRAYGPGEVIPIGRPFRNSGVFLRGEGGAITTPGEIGEICVYGTCLALGYYNDPDRTAAAFCQSPVNSLWPERIYRTGDLASYDEAGDLIFRGRADTQVKHMGHRIELAEIETAAQAGTGLSYVCCLFDEPTDKLWFFYQSKEDLKPQLTAALKTRVPAFMMPARFVRLDKMPENRTGKIDRLSLRRNYMEAGGEVPAARP